VLQCSSCLPEQGLLRSRDKNSGLPNPEHSQLSPTTPYPGGATPNCKHPYSVLTVAQYQTSYLHNIPPHSNKRKGSRVKINGGDFDIYGRGSSQRPREDLCRWSVALRPLFSQKPPLKEMLHLAPNAWRRELRSLKQSFRFKRVPYGLKEFLQIGSCTPIYDVIGIVNIGFHGAEPLLRSCQSPRFSRISQHIMQSEGSLPSLRQPTSGPYPEPY
jgi:hypothetical protein